MWIIEMRRARVWSIPLLCAVASVVITWQLEANPYALSNWRDRSWLGVFTAIFLSIVAAPLGAWVGSRDARANLIPIVQTSPRGALQRLVVQLLPAVLALVLGLVATLVVCLIPLALRGVPGAVWVTPIAHGAASVLAFFAVGFAMGVWFPTRMTIALCALAAFPTVLIGLNGPQQVEPFLSMPVNVWSAPAPMQLWGHLLACAALVAGSLSMALYRRDPKGGRARVLATVLATASFCALGVAVRAESPVVAARPNQVPVCQTGTVSVCVWPEHAAYLPEVYDQASTLHQLRLPGALGRTEFYEEGLDAPPGTMFGELNVADPAEFALRLSGAWDWAFVDEKCGRSEPLEYEEVLPQLVAEDWIVRKLSGKPTPGTDNLPEEAVARVNALSPEEQIDWFAQNATKIDACEIAEWPRAEA